MADEGDISLGLKCLLSATDTSPLLSPIDSAPRIKYTCVATSQQYIALGANTGGVYCFYLEGYRYIRILANQEGGVAVLKFSPSGTTLAVCCGQGHVSFWELNLTEQGISKRVHVSTLLKGSRVVDMVWDSKGSRLFFGDDQGRIAVSYMPKKVFKKPDELLYQEKQIVQMDLYQDLLLVSTVTRCLILNVASRELVQVGKRSREGSFGACFNIRWTSKPPVVYSARPKGRLWEADINGIVVSTLRLRELITAPSLPLLGYGMSPTPSCASPSLPLHFSTLSMLSQHYLVCWAPGALYLFHSASYQLAGWTEALGPEEHVHCDGNRLLLLSQGGRAVRILQFADISTSLQKLVQLGLYQQANQLMETYSSELRLLVGDEPLLFTACATALRANTQVLSQQLTTLQEALKTTKAKSGMAEVGGPSGDVGVATDESEEDLAGKRKSGTGNGECEVAIEMVAIDETLGVNETGVEEVNHSNPLEINQTPSLGQEGPAIDGIDADGTVAISSFISVDADFPAVTLSSPSSLSVDVTDMDSTLVPGHDEEEEQLELNSNLLVSPLHPQSKPSLPLMSSEDLEGPYDADVTRSQFKVIPESSVNGQGERTPESTPSSSVSGSVGQQQLSLDQFPVSGDVIARNLGVPPAADKLSWPPPAQEYDTDVIAVPVIMRSASTGSLSGKSKSKKKSRRKKTANVPPPQNQSISPLDSGVSSLPKSSVSPSSLIHIPEEDLPFPEAGLPPSSLQSSPSTSHNVSPHPSLPSTPPQCHTPPAPVLDRGNSHAELSQRENELPEKVRTSRSSSIDITGIGGALSKVKSMAFQSGQNMGQKVVKGLFSSLSTSHDSHGTAQPVLYRNNDITDVRYTTGTPPVAIATTTSPSGSVEQGEFASMASPLSDYSGDWLSSTSPPGSVPSPTPLPVHIPHTDTMAFSNITVETRSELENVAVLCSPDGLCSALRCWLQSLEEYMAHIKSAPLLHMEQATPPQTPKVPSLLEPPPPFSPLSHAVASSVTYLATLCAELGVYSSAGLSDERSSEALDVCNLETFITHYAELLDWARIRCLLARHEWEVRARGWWALITARGHFNTCSVSMDKSHPNNLTDQEMLSSLLQCPCSSEEMLTLTISAFPRLMPWEVALACNIQSDEFHKGSHDPSLYVAYLSRLFGNQESDVHLGIVEEVFECDHTLLTFSLQAVLGEGHQDHTHTLHRKPRAWSHMIEWAEAQSLECLVAICASLQEVNLIQAALTMCQNAGYWLGAVRLLVAIGDRKAAIETILALGDMKLLTQPQPWGDVLGNVEDWQLVLDTMATPVVATPTDSAEETFDLEDSADPLIMDLTGEVKGCGSVDAASVKGPTNKVKGRDSVDAASVKGPTNNTDNINKSNILGLLLSWLPPENVEKLVNSSLRPFLSKEEMHSLLVATTSLHTQQRALAHSLLERVDRYLWAPRPSALGPHVYSTLTAEKDADTIKETTPSEPLPFSSLSLPPTLEETTTCHSCLSYIPWGHHLSLWSWIPQELCARISLCPLLHSKLIRHNTWRHQKPHPCPVSPPIVHYYV